MEESYLRAMGFRRRRTNRAPLCASGAVAGMWCRVWGACQRVAENAPTVLPLAQRAFRFPPARGALGPLRFARALDCFAICAASRRETAAHFSAIVRLRSGAVASRSAPLRGGRSAAGAFSATVGTGAQARMRGGHLAPACPCGVGCAPHPPMSGIRLGRNTSRRRLPPLGGDVRIPPPVRAPAPFPAARPLAR